MVTNAVTLYHPAVAQTNQEISESSHLPSPSPGFADTKRAFCPQNAYIIEALIFLPIRRWQILAR
jgi:hypothetical protein